MGFKKYKRGLFILSFFVSLFGVVIGLEKPLHAGEVINVIQNGGFENTADAAWGDNRYEGVITLGYDSNVVKSGRYSMRVTGSSGSATGARGGVRQYVDVSPYVSETGTYRLKASYRTEDVSNPDSVRIRLMFYDADGTQLRRQRHDPLYRIDDINVNYSHVSSGRHFHIEATELAEDEWKNIEMTFTPPEGTVRITFALLLWHDTGTIWWDDVSLEWLGKGGQDGRVEWLPRDEVIRTPYKDAGGVSRKYIDRAERIGKVNDVASLRKAIQEAEPGDVILLEDGEYKGDGTIFIEDKHGNECQPIVIAAENIGKAVMTGPMQLFVKESSYIVIEGLSFETTVDDVKTKDFVWRRTKAAVSLLDAYKTRITRNRFALNETYGSETRREWLSVDGSEGGYNRIDHNLFENKVQVGNFIAVNADMGRGIGKDTSPRHTRIDHNHFRDIAGLGINGLEAIVLGMASYRDASNIDAHSIVEYNLFERTDGERSEIISVKDSSNIVRYNTILNSDGAIVTRYGHRASIYGNIIDGNGKSRSGGVRIYGVGHKVYNNYFENLKMWAVNIGKANVERPEDLPGLREFQDTAEDVQVDDLHVIFNTLVNNDVNFIISSREDSYLEPKNVTIANNLIVTDTAHVIGWNYRPVLSHEGLTWSGNMVDGSERLVTGIDEFADGGRAFRVVDSKAVRGLDGILHVGEDSPAVDAAVGTFPYVTADIEGKPRGERPDVGAFEYGGYPMLRGPIKPEEVGPYATVDLSEFTLDDPGAYITEVALTTEDGVGVNVSEPLTENVVVQVDGVVLGEGDESVTIVARVDGETEIYRGSSFPAIIPLDISGLDEGLHRVTITARRADRQSVQTVSFIVQNVAIQSPEKYDDIYGTWPVRMDVRLPEHVVQGVRVTLDDAPVYEGERVPEALTLNTAELEDGHYTLRVEIDRKGGGTSATSTEFRVKNAWSLSDALKAPVDFFGQVIDQSETIAASEGWTYASNRPADFFGDADRIVNPGDENEYLLWETPHWREAVVTLYSRQDDALPGSIRLHVSEDGDTFVPVDYAWRVVDTSSGGWHKIELTAAAGDSDDIHYVRLEVQGADGNTLQIGHVKLTGMNR